MDTQPPDPPIRKSVTLPASMWREVGDYRFAERIGTEAEAVRRLLLAALRAAHHGGQIVTEKLKATGRLPTVAEFNRDTPCDATPRCPKCGVYLGVRLAWCSSTGRDEWCCDTCGVQR